MSDRRERQALHRLCDSVDGANWRPTLFVDELTLSRYACCVCHVVPSITVVLPCSHALCEQCVTGCVVQDGGSVCPLDAEPFCEDECQRSQLPPRKKQHLKAHCWNEADGCKFVGTIKAVLLHFERECTFHSLQCSRCERRVRRTDIAAHYVAGCSQNAFSASAGQPHRKDGSTSFDASVILDKVSALQRQMNEVSACSQDMSRAVSGFENSIRRGMESIEANICTTVTRQMNAGLEELRPSNIDPFSDHLSSLQGQMNELVEQSRQRDASQIHEIERVLRDSQVEVKEDVKVQLQEIVPVVRASESELKESVKTQIRELVHVVRDSGCELKEHVSRVEASLSSRLTEQRQSLQGALDSLKQNCESAEREGHLSVAASEKQKEIPFRFKLDMFVNESLKALELERQQAYKHSERPWVSSMFDFNFGTYCTVWNNDFRFPGFVVTLENWENIFSSDSGVGTVANKYYRDMLVQICFSADSLSTLWVRLNCLKTLGNSSFPFTTITVNALRRCSPGFVTFFSDGKGTCRDCSSKHISHHSTLFWMKKSKLTTDAVIIDGKLTLKFEFK